jgi:hypothetical protein
MAQQSFNQQFCIDLEYYLCDVFTSVVQDDVKGFWCDGVLAPFVDNELSKKHVNERKQIITRAFVGRSGQEEYTLVLTLGKLSLRRFANDRSLNDCLPDIHSSESFVINVDKRTIQLFLK